jgi:hypothetical protein
MNRPNGPWTGLSSVPQDAQFVVRQRSIARFRWPCAAPGRGRWGPEVVVTAGVPGEQLQDMRWSSPLWATRDSRSSSIWSNSRTTSDRLIRILFLPLAACELDAVPNEIFVANKPERVLRCFARAAVLTNRVVPLRLGLLWLSYARW